MKGDDRKVCGRPQHPCGMPGGRPKARFNASTVVLGTDDVLGRRLMHLDRALCGTVVPVD